MKVHDLALAGIAKRMAARTLVGSYIALRGRAVMALRAGAVPAAAVETKRACGRKISGINLLQKARENETADG